MNDFKVRLNLNYLWHRIGEDWPALVMLALLMLVSTSAVAVAEWAEGLWMLPTIGLIALFLGYLLAISQFSEFTTILMGVLYGALFIIWMISSRFLPEDMSTRQKMIEVVTRVVLWVEQALEGGFSRDNLMFVLSMASIVWLLGFNAAANMFRSRRLWYAVIPPGLALLINTYYYSGESRMDLFLIGYLFLSFTLAVRTNAVSRERLWRVKRVGYTPGTRFDLVRAGMIAGVIVIALAWSAPAASASNRLADAWDRSVNPWHRVQDTFQRLFGGVQGGSAVTADYYGGPTLSMGGPVNLSNATVMYVYAPSSYRYYWRSRVFDTYEDGKWLTSTDARHSSDFGILGVESSEEYAMRRAVQQRFELQIRASRLVYAAPQPVSFASLPISYDVEYTQPQSEDFTSVKVIRAQDMLEAGESYSATSSISVADEQSLRAAGTSYPAWVEETYLGLPEEVTDRTRDLAAQIAAPYDNPYDQARAIEQYLRENIAYNQSVQPVPAGSEAVDYFLFESKEGYCTYYAGAMAVMLRSVGIPARLAAGFAQGERDPAIDAFRVAESDAHSWVEAYFPGYGWIEFEPTSAIEPIARASAPPPDFGGFIDPREQNPDGLEERLPDGGLNSEDESLTPLTLLERIRAFRVPAVVWWILGTLGLLTGGLAGAWFWIERRGLDGMSEVSRSYARLNIYAPWLGVRLPDSATPLERADQIGWATREGEPHVDRITGLYVTEQYAPKFSSNGVEHERAEAIAFDAWRLLRPKMLRAIAQRWVDRINPLKRGK